MVAFVAEFSLVIGEQTGTADKDEVVILGEVLEEEPEPTEVGKVHQMRVVEDRGQRLPGVVEGEGPFAELAFAGEGGVVMVTNRACRSLDDANSFFDFSLANWLNRAITAPILRFRLPCEYNASNDWLAPVAEVAASARLLSIQS